MHLLAAAYHVPATSAGVHSRATACLPRRPATSLALYPSAPGSRPKAIFSSPKFASKNPFWFFLRGTAALCSFLGVLPPDFVERWRQLQAISEEAESGLSGIPSHLVQAIVASEDCRFFYHFGVDLHGIARAVMNYPRGGGGSTITQQLMKRIFLTSERKISRKCVEGFLSLIVEKKIPKWKILYSYLSKMYWGHGIYGIEAASLFYLGKQPFFLTVGESALLVGILPAPELLNPFKNPSRGKSAQTRVLRRMVAAGFLDMETALHIANQPLCLRKRTEVIVLVRPPTYYPNFAELCKFKRELKVALFITSMSVCSLT